MRVEQPAPQQSPRHTRVRIAAREVCEAHEEAVRPEWPVRSPGTFRVLVTRLRAGSASRAARAAIRAALAGTGVTDEYAGEAELIVAELAANAEKHAPGPYELRVHSLSGIPMWCEMVNGGTDPGEVPALLTRLHEAGGLDGLDSADGLDPTDPTSTGGLDGLHGLDDLDGPGSPDLLSEGGRGLLLAHVLSGGRCYTYPTTMSTGGAGHAVAFALRGPVPPV